MESPSKKNFWDIESYPRTWKIIPREEWENDPAVIKEMEEENKFWAQVKFPEEILKKMNE